jgi:hypothetical protein
MVSLPIRRNECELAGLGDGSIPGAVFLIEGDAHGLQRGLWREAGEEGARCVSRSALDDALGKAELFPGLGEGEDGDGHGGIDTTRAARYVEWMISLEEARALIVAHTARLPVQTVALGDHFGFVLQQEVVADDFYPPWIARRWMATP